MVRLLRYGPKTESEARDRLRRRGHSPGESDEAIARARLAGMIDDSLFARLWVEDRILHHPISRRAVARELADKGISSDLTAAALEAGYPPAREPELALQAAEARFHRLQNVDSEKRARRTIDHLMRRGFSASVAREAIRRLEREEGEHS